MPQHTCPNYKIILQIMLYLKSTFCLPQLNFRYFKANCNLAILFLRLTSRFASCNGASIALFVKYCVDLCLVCPLTLFQNSTGFLMYIFANCNLAILFLRFSKSLHLVVNLWLCWCSPLFLVIFGTSNPIYWSVLDLLNSYNSFYHSKDSYMVCQIVCHSWAHQCVQCTKKLILTHFIVWLCSWLIYSVFQPNDTALLALTICGPHLERQQTPNVTICLGNPDTDQGVESKSFIPKQVNRKENNTILA